MGTLSAPLTRFPVSRETLENFRATEEGKRKVRGQQDERVEGENEDVRSSGTEERSIEPTEEAAKGGATDEEGPERENPGASHDPRGSWLTKKSNPRKQPVTYLGIILFSLPVIHWSQPHFSEFTDLGKKKENCVIRSEETTTPKNPSADYKFILF
ncbi:hypothetical protein NDU88_005388 [Pleurodeles waltl]|uniref:Uncharacterized protein n=1 Tax=Pleurodeles waltl TaxID=8319 RepID=A0AAV7M9U2_PLEWA|nr:hypothetical protein NDU88_005388 [Pleurodeles waltl]